MRELGQPCNLCMSVGFRALADMGDSPFELDAIVEASSQSDALVPRVPTAIRNDPRGSLSARVLLERSFTCVSPLELSLSARALRKVEAEGGMSAIAARDILGEDTAPKSSSFGKVLWFAGKAALCC